MTVTGPSMEPTYHDGSRLLVLRTPAARIRTGAVVVFRAPDAAPGDSPVVKRVAARPGDPVPAAAHWATRTTQGARVPRGSLVLLGDSPSRSTDSRSWGYVPTSAVIGVVTRALGG
ncbi:S26 family signal peptidase [Streptomyces sp. NPDC021020]|uniref:S26 family signal peptidase n=1 Tax=Streptomyces sp. NPDC021020 TaxID=3365109 RepID=UPI003787385D